MIGAGVMVFVLLALLDCWREARPAHIAVLPSPYIAANSFKMFALVLCRLKC